MSEAPGAKSVWRYGRATKAHVIVDGAEYFRWMREAMLNAQHRIMLIGWDFDTRIKFEPEEQTHPGPNSLGQFLSWLPEQRPDLRIYVLKWDLGVIQALGRGMTPVFILDWMTNKRLRFKLDGAHPAGAAHHQKIVVIDDALAFCGGIDMTVDLQAKTATVGDLTVSFEIDDYTRWRLLEGLDDIGLTLRDEDKITQFEARREAWRPQTLPVR